MLALLDVGSCHPARSLWNVLCSRNAKRDFDGARSTEATWFSKGARMLVGRIIAVGVCICFGVPLAHADPVQVANVASDFSATVNPNGVWQYGWSLLLGSPLILSTTPRTRGGLDTWPGDRAPDGNPAAYHNGTNGTIVLGG